MLVSKANLETGTRFEEILFEKRTISKNIMPDAISEFNLIRGCKSRGPISKGSGVSAFLAEGDCKLVKKKSNVQSNK